VFDLQGLLNYSWEIGICVLPLNDPGVFHGAAWNIDGVRVVVIKQNTKFHARWIFDLLHEVYHALAHLDNPNSTIVETQEINPFNDTELDEEKEANTFSHQVLFADRSEDVLNQCVQRTGGKMERLKTVVQNVARAENIREDILANFVAFRLSLDNQNWWGAASALQITNPDPFTLASEVLKKNISTKEMNEMEFNLLQMAISTTD
jgi:Zn-dependent peptidase ImmA (M78 family)